MITLEELKAIMPNSGSHAQLFLEPLQAAMREFGISDNSAREGAFLANVCVESGSLHYVREIASGEAYNGRADLGNTKPEAIRIASENGSTPGPWWKGRCPIQTTGYNNYFIVSMALYGDDRLLSNPQLLELPLDGSRAAGFFWERHGLNELADAGDFQGCCAIVDCGHRGAPVTKINGWSERLACFHRCQQVLT